MTAKSADLGDNEEKIRRLRRECLRLSRALAQERSRNEELRLVVRATLNSLTWRLASAANAIVGRLLSVGRGPAAWTRLNVLLEDFDSLQANRSPHQLVGGQDLHAEASCNLAGFTLLGEEPEPGFLLLVGQPSTCPYPHIHSVKAAAYESALTENDGCWAVVALLCDGTSNEDLESVLVAAEALEVPAAAWLGSMDKVDRSLLDQFDLVAGEAGSEYPDSVRQVANELQWNRLLSDLRGRAKAGSCDLPFTERAYLLSNPDVQQAIDAGDFRSAREHWDLIGRHEFADGSRTCRLRQDVPSLGLRRADEALVKLAQKEFDSWSRLPIVSLLVPVYKVELKWLKACVGSVVGQIYPHWQLCLVDDASNDPGISAFLASLDDQRIRVSVAPENLGISGASNLALALATGEYIGLLDHDDELTVDALWLVARVITTCNADLIYSDEAKLDLDERIVEPHFKPDFSATMVLTQNYISHLGVYRKSIVDEIGGFRTGVEGSQDHDLLLRFLSQARSVFHIPRILYYWRKVPQSTASRFGEKNYAWDNGVKAVSDHLGEAGAVEKGRYPGTYRVKPALTGEPEIAIIIPFRDQPDLLADCLESLTAKTGYRNYNVLCVDNQSRQPKTAQLIKRWQQHKRVSFLHFDAPFNFSAINNFAAMQTDAEQLLLLNNDITILDEHWLETLLAFSQQPGTGAVGGLLLYPDHTIQHAGVILGVGGVAGHSHKYLPESHHGYFCRPHIGQNISAITGACLMVKRKLFVAAGGLDESNLQIAFNDVDFCLRLREWGFENIYTPDCRLIHHESKSRGAEDTADKQRRFNAEARYMRNRHALALSLGDPFYNPNLTLVHENFSSIASAQTTDIN